jgi:hypothetical protein
MRWLFADPKNPVEAEYVREKVSAIDAWWQAFQAKAPDIRAVFESNRQWNLSAFMREHLEKIHARIMWEFGPAMRQPGHRLIVTPESARWLRPMVQTMLERAPKLDGWEFYQYRMAENAELAIQAVRARAGVDISKALIEASAAPGRKIDLYYSFPDLPDLDEQLAIQAAFVATESLMGEHVLDTWIGTIGLADGESGSGRPLALERAQATVGAIIRSFEDQLPSVRMQDIAVEGGWATVQLDPPEQAEDYPDRSDLISAVIRDVELFQAMHGSYPFASTCHSKVGELFCYLKIDASEVPSGQIVAFRSRFEDALNPALTEANVGCCIGGGSGLRYAYIDLALTDVGKAALLIRKVLSEKQAPPRTWLLFHDDDLAAEWVGIYPQTPPPPNGEEDDE